MRAPDAAGAHARQIEMAAGTPGCDPGVIGSCERVVVAVENGNHGLDATHSRTGVRVARLAVGALPALPATAP